MEKANSSDLPHNLVGFVNDPVSQQMIANIITSTNMSYSESLQGSISDVIEFLKNNRTPRILMVDISDSELPLGDIAKIKEYSAPNLNIVAIGSRNDVGLFRDLKKMDICDYLVKPLSDNLLHRTIESINTLNSEYVAKTGRMIQFISSVGGAGATTIATNIGWILANRHFKRTVVMDMDFFYGTANLLLDLKTERSYLDLLESSDRVDDYFIDTILRKHGQRLYYLGGLVDLMRGISVDLEAFETLMNLIKTQFNYLLMDTQRDISDISKICMNKTDNFVIIVEMSVASASNTARMLEFLNSYQSGKKIIIVANKVGLSNRGALAKELFEKVIERKIDYLISLDESVTLAAANIGQPLVMSSGPLTEILENITDDILGKKESENIAKELLEREGWTYDRIKRLALDMVSKMMSRLK
ncbi:MAG: AAA family ATPase [Holosporaceae bacterium]|jgi:pilus assembly protein CpaE|nr:AAA family ATPase [Holosporaceae bacterium]